MRRRPGAQAAPVDSGEEFVRFDAREVEALVAAAQQLGDEAARLGGDFALLGELERRAELHDLLSCLLGRLRVEGRVPHDHLVQDHAQRPPVAFQAVASLEEHLWRHVVGRPHPRPHLR